jgi:hypothetical protein
MDPLQAFPAGATPRRWDPVNPFGPRPTRIGTIHSPWRYAAADKAHRTENLPRSAILHYEHHGNPRLPRLSDHRISGRRKSLLDRHRFPSKTSSHRCPDLIEHYRLALSLDPFFRGLHSKLFRLPGIFLCSRFVLLICFLLALQVPRAAEPAKRFPRIRVTIAGAHVLDQCQ